MQCSYLYIYYKIILHYYIYIVGEIPHAVSARLLYIHTYIYIIIYNKHICFLPISLVECGKVRWEQPLIDLHVFPLLFTLVIFFFGGLFISSRLFLMVKLCHCLYASYDFTYIGCKSCFRWGLGLELLARRQVQYIL